jgi:hypothetical protein
VLGLLADIDRRDLELKPAQAERFVRKEHR